MEKELLPPKFMTWSYNLSQTHRCDQSVLITNGCSFTASTRQLESAASWPGYMRDRCGFDHAVDLSYPGMGNDYICDTTIDYVSQKDSSDIFVMIMWSGIDRRCTQGDGPFGLLPPVNKEKINLAERRDRAELSFKKIQELKDFLIQKNIPHAFTQYINLLYPPYLPSRDTTGPWEHFLNFSQLEAIKRLIDVPAKPVDYLYDYAFYHDYLNEGDNYHPPSDCNLAWTDAVLLPNLAQKGLIFTVDQ